MSIDRLGELTLVLGKRKQSCLHALQVTPRMAKCLTCNRSQIHPQDGLWSWAVCFCATFASAIIPGLGFSFGALLPTLMSYFNSGRQKTAWIGSLALALMTLLGPITSPLCERYGCRSIAIAGGLLCALSILVSSFVNKLELLYFTYGIIFGIGDSFVFTASLLITTKYFTRWRSLALSFVAGGFGAGLLIYGPGLLVVIENVGWKMTFRIMVGMMGLVIILSLSFDENSRPSQETIDINSIASSDRDHEKEKMRTNTHQGEDDGTLQSQCKAASEDNKKLQVVRRQRVKLIDCSVWRVPMFTIVTLTATVGMLVEFNPQIHLIKYTEELGFEPKAASRLFIYLGISTFVARPISGILCSVPRIKPQYVFQAALLINGVSTVLLPSIETYSQLIGYVIVYGACDGMYISMLNVLILSSVEAERLSSALGMELFLTALTTLVGPPIAGLIGDSYGTYKPAFYIGGGISIFAGSMMFLLFCFKSKSLADQDPNPEVLEDGTTRL